jgi:hypothetical protein
MACLFKIYHYSFCIRLHTIASSFALRIGKLTIIKLGDILVHWFYAQILRVGLSLASSRLHGRRQRPTFPKASNDYHSQFAALYQCEVDAADCSPTPEFANQNHFFATIELSFSRSAPLVAFVIILWPRNCSSTPHSKWELKVALTGNVRSGFRVVSCSRWWFSKYARSHPGP